MMHTITDGRNRQFLVLPVTAERNPSEPHSPDEAQWHVHVSDPGCALVGMCAHAATLAAARDAIVVLAWTAVAAGELSVFGIDTASLAGVRVLLTTSLRYDARDLDNAMEGAA